MHSLRRAAIAAATLLVAILSACAGPVQRAEQYAAQDEWLRAVVEYRKAYTANPRDVEYRSRLKQMELKAADYYYQKGMSLIEQGNVDSAIVQYQQGLASMPDHSKLQQAMANAMARKEANSLYVEAVRNQEAGKPEDARRSLQAALQANPDHKPARELANELQKQLVAKQDPEQFALSSRAPITLNFRQTDLKTAFEFIAKSFGVTVIFDEGIKSVPVTLFAQDVTFEQALNLMFATHKVFYKKIGNNTILLIPDTKEKRGQYEDHLVRSFQLNTVKAKDMADILKGLLTVKKIIINDDLNTLVVRDTEDTLKLVDKLIDMNDRKPAEMILEVEILEVNRSKAEQLGLNLGSYSARATVPQIPLAGSVTNFIQQNSLLTLSEISFRLYKQDVEAKTLANPKVRVINGKAAKIHVGDRVPLRAATITDATGQVRTTYDYKEIGIKLNAEPTIHIDNSATVKLGLEVSTLGENLGTQTEPAFRIGTRNAETFMLLRDGETAILGGLIRDEDRNTTVRVPLLGDIPILGYLFRALDRSVGRTDVLLTITPRVVRGWDPVGTDSRQFYSGTAETYLTQALFANMTSPAAKSTKATPPAPTSSATAGSAIPTPPPAVTATTQPAATPAETAQQVPQPVLPPVETAKPSVAAAPPIFAFGSGAYETSVDQPTEIKLTGENLSAIRNLSMEILFNPQLLGFVRGEAGDFKTSEFKAEVDEARGTLKVTIDYPSNAEPVGGGTLARIVLQPKRPGTSYLVYRAPNLKNVHGEPVAAQVRGARIHIK